MISQSEFDVNNVRDGQQKLWFIFGAQLYEWQWLQTLYRTQSRLLRTKISSEKAKYVI